MGSWPAGGAPRTALITGAAHGIGAAAAERLAARGWQLALLDIDGEVAEQVAARCGGSAAGFRVDITDQASVDEAVAVAVDRFGGIDVCFANAGIATEGSLRHLDPEVFAVQTDVNLVGTFRTVRACLPHVIERRGYMLLNASASAIAGPPGLGAYAASKAGVESLGDTLRREVRHLGVDVGVVYLLFIETDMVQGAEAHGRIFRTIRGSLRGPLAKLIPLSGVAAAIERGIERRVRRVVVPGFARAMYRLRGIPSLIGERDMFAMAEAVEQATARDLEEKGLEASVRTDTPATAAAAEQVRERA
jgi:NAD(P)-dependent dehydrogenase (short-subunit alcohol dehydrogenase family)